MLDIENELLEYCSTRRKEIENLMFEPNGYTPKQMTKIKWSNNSGKIEMLNEIYHTIIKLGLKREI